MPKFSRSSSSKLYSCDDRLKTLFMEVIRYYDCKVIYGHRGEWLQNRLFEKKKTKKRWPNSKHNRLPSQAIDVVPYPVDWQDKERFIYFAGLVMGIAKVRGIPIRWGGDWNMNWLSSDETFFDGAHYELIG